MAQLRFLLEFKKEPGAYTPQYSSEHATGLDLFAYKEPTITEHYIEYDTGIAVAIPPGWSGFVLPRSSVTNKPLMLKNGVGNIDPDYRGTIKARFYLTAPAAFRDYIYKPGEKIAQLILVETPKIQLFEVEQLSETARGTGGFGSTGK